MRRLRVLLCSLVTLLLCFGLGSADDSAEQENEYSLIRIIAEPKTTRPFDWNRGQRVTVGVRFVATEEIRVIGIATNIELVATKTYENRVEMMLRGTQEQIDAIRKAAATSEYWFEIMPFAPRHIETLKKDVPPEKFASENKNHRPAGADDWGYGAKNGRLTPPTSSELPIRKVSPIEQTVERESP